MRAASFDVTCASCGAALLPAATYGGSPQRRYIDVRCPACGSSWRIEVTMTLVRPAAPPPAWPTHDDRHDAARARAADALPH